MFQNNGGRYTAERNAKIWNTRFSGKEAFTAFNAGYRHGQVFRIKLRAHRVIWMMVHGEWPEEIDHINHNRGDNRIVNLRNVSRAVNMKNKPMQVNNTSGCVGVTWDKSRNKWKVRVHVKGKSKFIGDFSEIEDAISARKDAEPISNYHENHGAKP
jgi:hypothetical protein